MFAFCVFINKNIVAVNYCENSRLYLSSLFSENQKFELAVVNPSLVVGPTLHGNPGSSVEVSHLSKKAFELVRFSDFGFVSNCFHLSNSTQIIYRAQSLRFITNVHLCRIILLSDKKKKVCSY